MDFKKIFVQSCNEFKISMQQKLRDNIFRSVNENVRKIQSHPIHQAVFSHSFKPEDLDSIRLIYKVFGGKSMIKINQYGDVQVIFQHCYVTRDCVDSDLIRGDVVFPVNKQRSNEEEGYQVFVQSSVEDEEVTTVSLMKLIPSLNAEVLPEKRLENFSLTVSKGENYVSVKHGHGLKVDDFLLVRGINYRIINIHYDDCFSHIEGSRNIIIVDKPFQNNINSQAFRFRNMVHLNGKLAAFSFFKEHSFLQAFHHKFQGK